MSRIIKYFTVLLVLTAAVYLSARVFNGYVERRSAEIRIQSIPDVAFTSLYGGSVSLRSFDHSRPLIVKYFHPECEYCRHDAAAMIHFVTEFSQAQMVMITPDDSLPRVEQFVNEYHLQEIDNVQILLDPNKAFRATFGRAVIPSVYIYGTDQKLAGQFLGETHPEYILNHLTNISFNLPDSIETNNFSNPSL